MPFVGTLAAMPELFPSTDRAGLPQTTKSGFYYEIDPFTYREAWVPGANRTVIDCRVDANESFDWITDMVGRSYMSGTTLRRDLPEQNPFDVNQWCTKVEQIDQGGINDDDTLSDAASGWPFTKWQRYRCTFEGMPFAMRDDAAADSYATTQSSKAELSRYVVRGQRTYAKEQQIPGGAFKIVDDGTAANRLPLMQTGFKTRVFGDVTYTLVRWPVTNFPAEWKNHRGKINSAAFDASSGSGEGYAWAAGELLYVGYDDNNKYFDANEDWVADVVLQFKFCQGGWNYFLNSSGALVEVSTDGLSSGTKPYSTAQLYDLFEV